MPSKKTPLIHIVSWHNNKLRGTYPDAHFYLELDNWNDYSFYTSYHLHVSKRYAGDSDTMLIGALRILRRGQTTGSMHQLPVGPLEDLGEEYCSMPNSLDYYERLSKLPVDIRDRILLALRDLVINPEIRDEFKEEEGYRISLLRDIKEDDQIFELAPVLLSRNYSQLQNLNVGFSFQTPEMEQAVKIEFNSPGYGWRGKSLPDRIAVLIGRNGSGKSTLLNRLSRIAYASTLERNEEIMQSIGILEPEGLGFTRIIALSYSAFDAFNTPGIYKADKLAIIEEMKNGLGRYVSCGIRDIVMELEDTIPLLRTKEDGKLMDEDILSDRTKTTILKSNAELSKEFSRNLTFIKELKQEEMLDQAIQDLAEEQSMFELLPEMLMKMSSSEHELIFTDLSTGHKFVMHAVTSIIAFGAPRALFLFDEPETHLHPPLLAVLMKAIRRILEAKDAFMILATHSPIILQETLQQHVSVVRREGSILNISRPEVQTFGENIGILTQLAFGLTAEVSDYHNTLLGVIKAMGTIDEETELDDILERIENLFGIGLSVQARSYVISKLYQNN